MSHHLASVVAAFEEAMGTLAELFARLRTQRALAIRGNARLDSLAPHITCPKCKNGVTTDVINPLPRFDGLEALSEDLQPVDHKSLVCEECDSVLYPPPHYHLRRRAADFHETAKHVRSSGNPVVTAYLFHHAAELYLKSLGSYEIHERRQPEGKETIEGEVLEHTKHELSVLYNKLPRFVKTRLEATQEGKRLMGQVKSLPHQLSVTLRYGAVFKPPAPPELMISDGAVILPRGQNLTRILERLCSALSSIRGFD